MYAIRKTRCILGSGKCPCAYQKSYVRDEMTDKRAEFKYKAEAQAVVDSLDGAVYYLSHNEAGRAAYKVVRVS